MSEIQCTSSARLVVSGTILFHLCMGESRPRVNYGEVSKFAIILLLKQSSLKNIYKVNPRDGKDDCPSPLLAGTHSHGKQWQV